MSEQGNNKKIIGANQKYISPEYNKLAFHCSHCEVYASQIWCNIDKHIDDSVDQTFDQMLRRFTRDNSFQDSLHIKGCRFSFCSHCEKYSIWVNRQMVYPGLSTAPLPVEEMPESVKELYNEAREIIGKSPRGACALLRLAVEFLVKEFREDEGNLNKAIGNLVKKGLPEKIQKALDSVRVIGNNAVHPGEIDIKDKPEIANTLFNLINFICEKMIKDHQTVESIYSSLPENTRKVTEQRDRR